MDHVCGIDSDTLKFHLLTAETELGSLLLRGNPHVAVVGHFEAPFKALFLLRAG